MPAKEIMRLSEHELDSVLEQISAPKKMGDNLARHIQAAIEADRELAAGVEVARNAPPPEEPEGKRSPELLINKTFDCMEEIPPSWMVRTHQCGSSNLKALVGTGLMLKGDDTAELAPGVKVGAGWAQIGNRRVIDFRDKRFIDMQARHNSVRST